MLLMVRKEGTAVYGGTSLTEDFEQTFDHMIRVDKIVDRAHVNMTITRRDGSTQHLRLFLNDDYVLDNILHIVFVDVLKPSAEDDVYAARLGFAAPKSYKLVRDNAINRTG